MEILIQLENFTKALTKLEEYLRTPVEDDRDRCGIIQAFEFTFEQCWQTFKKLATEQGFIVRSPKEAISAAFRIGWIRQTDEDEWFKMLIDRNKTSHVYREEVSLAVYENISSVYFRLFYDALNEMKKYK